MTPLAGLPSDIHPGSEMLPRNPVHQLSVPVSTCLRMPYVPCLTEIFVLANLRPSPGSGSTIDRDFQDFALSALHFKFVERALTSFPPSSKHTTTVIRYSLHFLSMLLFSFFSILCFAVF